MSESRQRDSKLENNLTEKLINTNNNHYTNNTLGDNLIIDPYGDGEHLKDSSETTIFTSPNVAPTRLDLNSSKVPPSSLLNNILILKQEHQNEFLKSLKTQSNSIRSGIIFQTNSTDIFSMNNSNSNASYRQQMQIYKKNVDMHSQQTIEKYRAIMNNLGEAEFINFLKTYRETKTISPNFSGVKQQSVESFKPTNTVSSIEPNSISEINSCDKLSVLSHIDNDDDDFVQRKFMNLQTQSISLENSYIPIKQQPRSQGNSNKMSNFYVNYISNKLMGKSEPHNLTAITNNILSDRQEETKQQFYKNMHYLSNNNASSNKKKANGSHLQFKSGQRFRI